MIPGIPVIDLMKRTVHNLEIIERLECERGDSYEVTQLVNSFLAALAHPWEEWEQKLNGMELVIATERGWPQLDKSHPLDDDPKNLGDLLRLVRNAFAHGNVELLPDSQRNIRALHIWNEDGGYRTWGTEATLGDIRKFLDCFVALADTLGTPRPQGNMRHRNDPNNAKTRKVKCPTCGKRVSPDRIRNLTNSNQQMLIEEAVPITPEGLTTVLDVRS